MKKKIGRPPTKDKAKPIVIYVPESIINKIGKKQLIINLKNSIK